MDAVLYSLQTYWPVHLLLLLYACLLGYHAWTGHRATRGVADYYVGGRSMGGVVLGLSFFATYSSTNSSAHPKPKYESIEEPLATSHANSNSTTNAIPYSGSNTKADGT